MSQTKILRKFIERFTGHVFIATTLFLMFGGVAVCLSLLVHFLESIGSVSPFTLQVLSLVESVTLVADALLYLAYVVVAVWATFKELLK